MTGARRWITPLSLMVLLSVVALAVAFALPPLRPVATTGLVMVVFVVGLYTFVGSTGLLSFGHAAFAAIGGYSTALLAMDVPIKKALLSSLPAPIQSVHLPGIAAILISAVVAGALAFVVALVLMGLSGVAASIATLSLLVITNNVARNWTQLTGGSGTLSGIPVGVTIWVALGAALLAIGVAWWYQTSTYGLRVRATRDDEVAARAVGVSVRRERVVAFTLSGAMAGAAGGVLVLQLGTVNPDLFFLQFTFVAIAMLVLGGRFSLSGAVLGVVLVTLVSELLNWLESGSGPVTTPIGSRLIILGLVIIVTLWRWPEGVSGGRELELPRLQRLLGPRRRSSSVAGDYTS